MELVLKVSITAGILVAVAFQVALLWGVWSSRVDPAQTFRNLFSQQAKPDWLATQEGNQIYQSGQSVGVVVGAVTPTGNFVVFERIVRVDSLKLDQPFRYQDNDYRVINTSSKTLLDLTISPPASSLEGVTCELTR